MRIVNFFLIVASLLATIFSFAQTEEQKEFYYQCINLDAKGNIVLPKTESFSNKEELFKKAKIIPVYKIVLNKNDKPQLVQNNNYYLVFYIGRMYAFLDNDYSMYFENSPILKALENFDKNKFYIVYLTEKYSLGGKYLKPLISNKNIDFIIDNDKQYSPSDYINYMYGNIEKFKEQSYLDKVREELKVEDYIKYQKSNYRAFEEMCPNDTLLIINTFIGQIRHSIKGFTKEQEKLLIEKIKDKMNPNTYQLKKNVESSEVFKNINDTILVNWEVENEKKYQKYKECNSEISGVYEFKIFNFSITNELISILTDQQFIDYKKYIDLYAPVIETLNTFNNNKYRFSYGFYILERNGILKRKSFRDYQEYNKHIIEQCGCQSN